MKVRKWFTPILGLTLLIMPLTTGCANTSTNNTTATQQKGNTSGGYSLVFDMAKYTEKTLTIKGQTIKYRAFENIVDVKNPVDTKYECMNFYVPEEYYEGKSIGNFTAETAPIFLPNEVGGYMPAEPGSLGPKEFGGPGGPGQPGGSGSTNAGSTEQNASDAGPNAAFVALSKGYVVAEPGARGRTTQDENGQYTGKAPAGIVDLKAAVRYLRYNDKIMPGDAEKIISNGTSAGGALSSLLGATGNNKDYEPYLKAIGAADTRDDIFAASCYCPITNLDNADMAYEWMFNGLNDYSTREGTGTLTADQIKISDKLKAMFPAYLNGLGHKKADGTALTLGVDGNGTFKDYVKSFVIASAQKALDSGKDLSSLTWMTIKDGKVTDINFNKYVEYATRMKPTPAFDGLDLSTGENDLFGTAAIKAQHFTQLGKDNSTVGGSLADATLVKMMNPMNYIGSEGTTTATYWRIRHGAVDRDTSLAIPVILATTLEQKGFNVDFAVPWGQGHGGDYDLDELFAWIGSICGA